MDEGRLRLVQDQKVSQARTVSPPALIPNRVADSLAWMRPDALVRLVPFTAVVAAVWLVFRPPWLGIGPGRLAIQVGVGLPAAVVFFAAAALAQRALTRRRGSLRVPASTADLVLQAGYYLVNAPVEEAFFRGLLQGGLTAALGPAAGLAVGTSLYVLYHRLGGWAWLDVLATALVGVPVALAFWLLPGPPSLLGVSVVHFGATAGFLGPGPWLLRRFGLIGARGGGPPLPKPPLSPGRLGDLRSSPSGSSGTPGDLGEDALTRSGQALAYGESRVSLDVGGTSGPSPSGSRTWRGGLRGLDRGQVRVVALAGLATFFVSFDTSVLVLALPAIATDFRTSVGALTRVGSALALGTLAGLPIAMQADRFGRRRLLAIAVAGFSLANLVSAWAPSLPWLAAARMLAVCFETVAAAVATALVIEEVTADQRGAAVAAITIAAGAGTGATTLLYPLVAPNWRVLYVVGGAGLGAALLLAWLVRESRAWSHSVAAGGARRPVPLGMLLRPPWRRRLVVVAASGALGSLLYEPAGLLFALFGSRDLRLGPAAVSAVVVVSGLASIPAFVAGGRLSDRLGRRRLAVTLALLSAGCAALTFSGGRPAYWVGNVAWSVLASASVPIVGAWFGELFPTRARATSESAAALAAAVGGVAGYQLVGLLQPRLGLGPGVAATAGGALLAALLLLLLPETAGHPLDE